MSKYWIAFLYLATIVGVNFGFAHTELIKTPLGMLPPMTFIVGIVFVMRDYVQRAIGHKVLIFMVLGCVISVWMANPVVALASFTAFAFSELADWAVFTLMPGVFKNRVLFSSVLGVFVDSAIFLPMIGHFSWGGVFIMFCSKMVAAICVWIYYTAKKSDGEPAAA